MWLQQLFEAIAAIFSTVGKFAPTDHIKDGKFDIKKERLTIKQRIEIQNKEYARLKGHTGADIRNEINWSCRHLTSIDRELLITNVTQRVKEFRMRHRVIFKKWLKQNNL